MRSSLFRALLLLPLVLLAGACGDKITTPVTPTPTTFVTETFSGEVNVHGAVTHYFATLTTGTVTATLTALVPESTVTVGMSMGTWNGSTCAIVLANDKAVTMSTVTGVVSTVAGNLCVRVYDVGGMTETTSYELTVTHP